MKEIKVLGIDMSLNNLGCSVLSYDLVSEYLSMVDLKLFTTANEAGKVVRRSSDDLRRAKELHDGVHRMAAGVDVVMAEVPTGTQSSRGAMSNGIVIGVLASVPTLIEVSPAEAKKALIGRKTGSKDEMIEAAMALFPDAPWLMRKFKGQVVPVDANEHLADSVAIVKAGIATKEFQSALNMIRAMGAKR